MQKDKIENLEKELESQTKLINIKLINMSDGLKKHINETNELNDKEKLNFADGETKVVVNAMLYLDIK